MTQRITLYGWVINNDPVMGPGSGVLVDLCYFVSDTVSVEDVLRIVQNAGFKMVSKKISGTRIMEQDRVTIENWDEHIRTGVENVGNINLEQTTEMDYSRYNQPEPDFWQRYF